MEAEEMLTAIRKATARNKAAQEELLRAGRELAKVRQAYRDAEEEAQACETELRKVMKQVIDEGSA